MIASSPREHGGRLRPATVALAAEHGRGTLVFAVTASVVTALGWARGGYYPVAWAWASLVGLAVAAAALAAGGLRLAPRDWIALAALGGWLSVVVAGSLRPGAATAGFPVIERGALYVVALWAALLMLRRSTVVWALAGVLVGLVALTTSGLVSVIFPATTVPDVYEGRLLFRPLGYANGMGVLVAMGFVLALGFVAHGPALARLLGAAVLVPLAVALAVTGSRGALAALVAGVMMLVLIDDAAGMLVVVLPLPIVGAIVALQSSVADAHASAKAVVDDGRVIGIVVLALALMNGFVVVRVPFRVRLRHRAAVVIAGAIVLGAFAAAPFALADRLPFWRVAARDVASHPLVGSGPGSFAAVWLRLRDVPYSTLDAHNLYLQTLAELGPLGLLALALALAVPLTALRHARHPFAPTAGAGYLIFLVHAGVDWDWEIPIIPIVALLLGAVLLVAARKERASSGLARSGAAAATGLVAVAACAAAVGNGAFDAQAHAATTGDWARARTLAARAERWQPWSAEPLLALGRAQVATGDLRDARTSFARAARMAPSDWRPWYDLAAASHGERRRAALVRVARLVP